MKSEQALCYKDRDRKGYRKRKWILIVSYQKITENTVIDTKHVIDTRH